MSLISSHVTLQNFCHPAVQQLERVLFNNQSVLDLNLSASKNSVGDSLIANVIKFENDVLTDPTAVTLTARAGRCHASPHSHKQRIAVQYLLFANAKNRGCAI